LKERRKFFYKMVYYQFTSSWGIAQMETDLS